MVATLVSVKVIVDRRRSGMPLGRFMPIATAGVLVRGAIGAISNSETLYFGLGIATKYVGAAVLLGSVAIRRPIAELAAPYVMDIPRGLASHRLFRSTMAIITSIAALYYLASASLDIWLFQRSSVEGYVVWRFLANWPLSAIAIGATLFITQRRIRRIPDMPPLSELVERRMAAYTDPSTTPERDTQ